MTRLTKKLLTWFSKSLRPVATIKAPAFFAACGFISGVGFASAKIIGFSFIVLIISSVKTFGAESPTKTSAFLIVSCRPPFICSRFVYFELHLENGKIQPLKLGFDGDIHQFQN